MTRRRGRHNPNMAGLMAESSALLLALALALGGCGNSHNELDPGFPPADPHPHRATTWQPLLNGQRLRIPVPQGWGLARLNGSSGNRQLVRLVSPCYESVTITGSSVQPPSGAQISVRFSRSAQGYAWTLTRANGRVVAVLSQSTPQSTVPSRATVGTAYIPLDARRTLAVDFGVGVWPLRRGPCSESVIASLIEPLRVAVGQLFASAQLGDAAINDTGSVP